MQNPSLLVAEVDHCKKNHSLVVEKKSLVACWEIHSLHIAEVACCKKLLVTCCWSCSLLAAEVTRCKIFLITRWKIHLLLVVKNYLILVAEVARWKICLLLVGDVAHCNKLLVTSYKKKKKILKANKDTIWKFSNPYLANVPTESHTLNTRTTHAEAIQVIVIKKLID